MRAHMAEFDGELRVAFRNRYEVIIYEEIKAIRALIVIKYRIIGDLSSRHTVLCSGRTLHAPP